MLTISKNEIKEWLYIETLAEQKIFADKVTMYKAKYNSDFATFENELQNHVDNAIMENDYIDWLAAENFLKSYNERLKEIERGDFNIT